MNLFCCRFSIHQDGYKFIATLAGISFLFLLLVPFLSWIFMALTLFCMYFFRNPQRAVPKDENLIVSPSEGTVCAVSFEEPPKLFDIGNEKRYRVSIFLSVLDVHVNRLPVSGKVRNVIYCPGSFLNASLDKSSVFNEKNTVVVEMNNDPQNTVAFSQIAGFIARRIVCYVHDGQEIYKGAVFGLIRFGSRCDVWLPVGAVPLVCQGQTMISGETVLCDFSQKGGVPRSGEIV